MEMYKTKSGVLAGTDFREVHKKAVAVYSAIQKRSRRKSYIRSAYFRKDKIFLALFWQHLFDKVHWQDRNRRLRYYNAAIELIQKSMVTPESKENPNRPTEILHRFIGITREDEVFCVQIKESKYSGRKDFISVFPFTKKTFR